MTDRNDQRSPSPTESSSADGSWLADVAQAAGREAGGVPVELLGDYLTLLADAATTGRKPDPVELDAVRLLGRRAAELGVSAGSAVQLYLCAARRLCQAADGDPGAGKRRRASRTEAVLHVVDAAVANLDGGRRPRHEQDVGSPDRCHEFDTGIENPKGARRALDRVLDYDERYVILAPFSGPVTGCSALGPRPLTGLSSGAGR